MGCNIFTPLLWIGVLGIIYRVYVLVKFKKANDTDESCIKLHFISVGISGLFYSVLGAYTIFFNETANILVSYIIIAGVCAGAGTTDSSVKKTGLFILVLVPLISSGIIKGIDNSTFYLVAFTTILFLLFMYKIVDESNKTFMSAIIQAFEIADLNIEKETMIQEKEMRSNFFASVSHEIRTPLNGIFGLIYVLKDSDLSEDHVETIKHVSEYLLKVINDILDLSKMDMGKIQLIKVPVDSVELFNDVYKLYLARASSKNLDLILNLNNNIPNYLLTDGTRLRQVLNNLVSNAVKFASQGKIEINAAYEKGFLNIEGNDQGIGIPKDKLDSIFDRYE